MFNTLGENAFSGLHNTHMGLFVCWQVIIVIC
jgi:hypothetical protein